jgi:hypothetical protein
MVCLIRYPFPPFVMIMRGIALSAKRQTSIKYIHPSSCVMVLFTYFPIMVLFPANLSTG